MERVLVLAPHPDDETLGVGGTLLRHRDAGHELHWLIVTEMREDLGYPLPRIAERERVIDAVHRRYTFASVHALGFPAAGLDKVSRADLVAAVADVVADVQPSTVYLPHPGDVHTDHRDTFEGAVAALKVFRAPSVERILCYETPSETEMNPLPIWRFHPTSYVDISSRLEEKLDILRLYGDELGDHTFPRSEASVRALATIRGAQASFVAAEALMLVRERVAIS